MVSDRPGSKRCEESEFVIVRIVDQRYQKRPKPAVNASDEVSFLLRLCYVNAHRPRLLAVKSDFPLTTLLTRLAIPSASNSTASDASRLPGKKTPWVDTE
eukprot:196034-Rhodomonas_salina.2